MQIAVILHIFVCFLLRKVPCSGFVAVGEPCLSKINGFHAVQAMVIVVRDVAIEYKILMVALSAGINYHVTLEALIMSQPLTSVQLVWCRKWVLQYIAKHVDSAYSKTKYVLKDSSDL